MNVTLSNSITNDGNPVLHHVVAENSDRDRLIQLIIEELKGYFALLSGWSDRGNLEIHDIVDFRALFNKAPAAIQETDDYQSLSRKVEQLYSRTLVNTSPILPPPIIDDRETRSTLFSPGEMVVKDFNPKTGELTLKFTSKEQYRNYNRTLATTLAKHKNFALAKHYADRNGETSDLTTLNWLEKALQATAEQIRKENGEEWKAVTYEAHASHVTAKRQSQEQAYENSIDAMQDHLRSRQLSLNTLFHHFKIASSINPEAFEPHHFRLMLLRVIAKDFPEEAEEIVNEAYKRSPQKTFNFLMAHLIMGPLNDDASSSARFIAYFQLFLKRFPDDVTGHILANLLRSSGIDPWPFEENLESIHRLAFAQHLAIGLTEFRKGNWKAARAAFAAAEHFHISDKRSYLYRILIDLEEWDHLSAIKLLGTIKLLVTWNDEECIRTLQNQMMHDLGLSPLRKQKPGSCLEYPVINALIKICLTPGKDFEWMNAFNTLMHTYLMDPDADLLWGAHALDMALKRLGDISDCCEDTPFRSCVMQALMLTPAAVYSRLSQAGEDLKPYADHLYLDEGNQIIFRVSIIFCAPETEYAPLSIDPSSFEIPDGVKISLLHDLLWEKVPVFGLFIMRLKDDIDTIVEYMNAGDDALFYGPFLTQFLEHIHSKGTPQHRLKLLQSALAQRNRWPQAHQRLLSDYIYRWHLNVFVPSKADVEFTQLANQWNHPLDIRNHLARASCAWKLLQQQDVVGAQSLIDAFFKEWETHISEGIEFAALRSFCTVRTLLDERELAVAMPAKAESDLHRDIIQCALSLIAREGVQLPYVVPNIDLSRQAARDFCRLYLGQKMYENDVAYLKRIKRFSLSNTTDLRNTRHVLDEDDEMPEKNWITPSMRPSRVKLMTDVIKEEIAILQSCIAHTQSIAEDKPKYTDHAAFIEWVKQRTTLISDFLHNPHQIKTEFNQTFPAFPAHAREKFFNELNEKAEHEKMFRELKNKTPPASSNHGIRFWQLVLHTTHLIESVQSSLRSEGNYNIIVKTEAEARFVVLLINAWSGKAWKGSPQIFNAAFHGPEIHIWGEGPRINHFNAGVFVNGRLENVHVFYS